MGTQIVEGPMTVVGVSVGAAVDGAPGAAYGMAVSYALEAVLWWWQFGRALKMESSQDQPAMRRNPTAPALDQQLDPYPATENG
jgi:hypothetical protein